jgi:hypothetical protein
VTPVRVALVAVSLLLSASSAPSRCVRACAAGARRRGRRAQIVYRLQILRQLEVESFAFRAISAFRRSAPVVAGQSPDPAIADVGDHALIFEERRALPGARGRTPGFPQRASRA